MKKSTTALTAAAAFLCVGAVSNAGDGLYKMTALKNAPINIAQAVEQLEGKHNAVAVGIEVDDWKEMFVFEVDLVDIRNRLDIEVVMDMNTGRILDEKSSRLASWFNRNDSDRLAADIAARNGFGLKQAMALAEESREGVVLKSELEYKKGVVLAEVKMLTPNGKQKVVIDVIAKRVIHPLIQAPNRPRESNKAQDETAFPAEATADPSTDGGDPQERTESSPDSPASDRP